MGILEVTYDAIKPLVILFGLYMYVKNKVIFHLSVDFCRFLICWLAISFAVI